MYTMVTITEAVENIVNQDPLAYQALEKDLLSLASYTRKIKQQLEKNIGKEINEKSVMMALGRYRKEISKSHTPTEVNLDYICITKSINQLTLEINETTTKSMVQLYSLISLKPRNFIAINQNPTQINLTVNSKILEQVLFLFNKESIENHEKDLVAVTLRKESDKINLESIIKPLDLKTTNIIDTITTYNEITVIMDRKNLQKFVTKII